MNQTSIWIKAWVVNVEETRKSYFESIQQRKKKEKDPTPFSLQASFPQEERSASLSTHGRSLEGFL